MANLPFTHSKPKYEPFPYQEEALQALHAHICNKETNPCVVLPTGSGKSLVIAWIIQRWKSQHPGLRVMILAHREELVEQNSDELWEVWPEADIGINCNGLRRRDMNNSIIYASIDSVYKKGGDFEPFDVIIVDEAHRIPPKGDGKYRTFIKMQAIQNKVLKVVGFTATDYRMTGALCHPDHVLQEVCYEAPIYKLIQDGYLCPLWSKRSKDIKPDLSKVKRNSGGDYVNNSLAKATNNVELVRRAVRDAVATMQATGRRSVVFFCVDVAHVKLVSYELGAFGIKAPYVTAKTPKAERARIRDDFKAGRLHALCNVNVYTEGFNAKQVDCVVLLRPTLSKGLFVQMVGRGLRLHPQKKDCLVLDYANCIDEHGAIDCIDAGESPVHECGNKECGNSFSRQVGQCPRCGWQIPKKEMERMEAEERERRMHEAQASQRNIISGEAEELNVHSVRVHRHTKEGKPDSIRVEYRCGMTVIREWVCLDHPGPAGHKGKAWWKKRFGEPVPTVDEALSDMFLGNIIADITKTITVRKRGKFNEITGYKFGRRDVRNADGSVVE